MERMTKSIDVDRPLSHVYNQWTQFEEFPKFMKGVKEVRQLDHQRLHWRADVGGKEKNGPLGLSSKSRMTASPGGPSPANTLQDG